MRENQKTGRGEDHPPGGRVDLPASAIGLTKIMKNITMPFDVRAERAINPLAFEQQPRESDKAFAAFSRYLSLGPQRSLEAVATQLGKSKTLMERWCKRHACWGR